MINANLFLRNILMRFENIPEQFIEVDYFLKDINNNFWLNLIRLVFTVILIAIMYVVHVFQKNKKMAAEAQAQAEKAAEAARLKEFPAAIPVSQPATPQPVWIPAPASSVSALFPNAVPLTMSVADSMNEIPPQQSVPAGQTSQTEPLSANSESKPVEIPVETPTEARSVQPENTAEVPLLLLPAGISSEPPLLLSAPIAIPLEPEEPAAVEADKEQIIVKQEDEQPALEAVPAFAVQPEKMTAVPEMMENTAYESDVIDQQGKKILSVSSILERHEEELNNANSVLSQHEEKINSVSSTLSQQEERILSMSNVLDSQSEKINSISGILDSHSAKIDTLLQESSAISGRLDDLIAQFADSNTNLYTLIRRYEQSADELDTLYRKGNVLSEKFSYMQKNVDAFSGRLDTLHTNFTILSDNVAAYKNLRQNEKPVRKPLLSFLKSDRKSINENALSDLRFITVTPPITTESEKTTSSSAPSQTRKPSIDRSRLSEVSNIFKQTDKSEKPEKKTSDLDVLIPALNFEDGKMDIRE